MNESTLHRNMVVIGASSGGFEVIKKLISSLPPNFPAAIFIVWHMAPDANGILADVLNRTNGLYAADAVDGEEIKTGRVYVAPPDRHMVIENDRIHLTHGPRENRFRPAVDPLFRTAAFFGKERVIGIILSGALDDGTAGLWAIKERGGVTIVQDPQDAEVASMPKSAIREVQIDYVLPVNEMAEVLVDLCSQGLPVVAAEVLNSDDTLEKEITIDLQKDVPADGIYFGPPTVFSCPACGGNLSSIKTAQPGLKFRCHTGHAYSAAGLLQGINEKIEESLWNAIRGLDEMIALLNQIGDQFSENNQPRVAAVYFQRAKNVAQRNGQVRMLLPHSDIGNIEVESATDIPFPKK